MPCLVHANEQGLSNLRITAKLTGKPDVHALLKGSGVSSHLCDGLYEGLE